MKNFFSKKIVLGALVVATVCVSGITDAKAQEFTVQGDIVSSYVWRGMYQGGGAAFQPTLGFGFDNFSVTAWGSTNFSGGNKELDLTLAYKFGKAGPTLSVAWYTMFAGKDKKLKESGELKQNYSSYLELNYLFSVKNVDLNVTCGAVPYKAEGMYTNSGFAVTNVALKGMTEIKINDKFSLPIFAQAIWNPCVEDAFLVFGVTLRP